MQELVSMSCPQCGGRLQVGPQMQQFKCAHCGAEWRVSRGGGTISLYPPADRIASEMTIPRLEKEIDALILSLLHEADDRESLRASITQPVLGQGLGMRLLIGGLVLLLVAVLWAVAVRLSSSVSTPSLIGALALGLVGLIVCGFGFARWRAEEALIRQSRSLKSEQVTLVEQSLARTRQIEQVLAEKRAALEKHKALTES